MCVSNADTGMGLSFTWENHHKVLWIDQESGPTPLALQDSRDHGTTKKTTKFQISIHISTHAYKEKITLQNSTNTVTYWHIYSMCYSKTIP